MDKVTAIVARDPGFNQLKYSTICGFSKTFTDQVLKHLPPNLIKEINRQSVMPAWLDAPVNHLLSILNPALLDKEGDYTWNIADLHRISLYDGQQEGEFFNVTKLPFKTFNLIIQLSDRDDFKGGIFNLNGTDLALERGWTMVMCPELPFSFSSVTEGNLQLLQLCVY